MTEASDAGLRSPNLEGSPRTSSPDSAAIARVYSDRQGTHRCIRKAFQQIGPEHTNVLSLAYGVTFRDRDIDDGNRHKAPKKADRNWRVLLHDVYSRLGQQVAIVLATRQAIEAEGKAVSWLLSETAKGIVDDIEEEAIGLLIVARKQFSVVYVSPEGQPLFQDEPTKRKRGRPSQGDHVRVRAFHGIHDQEIGP
jgi:hypothetical protein